MGLCGSARCGCGIVSSDGSLTISGSGESGDPFDLAAVVVPQLVFYGIGTQVVSGAVDVTIDVEVFDIGTVGAVGSAVLTIPSTGLYVAILEASATGPTSLELRRAGPPAISFGSASVDTVAQFSSSPRYLTFGQTVTLRGGEDAAGGHTLTYEVQLYRIA